LKDVSRRLYRKKSLTDYTDYTDLVLETRILGLDFRNEDFRILGFRGFIYKPPKTPKIFHADHADYADYTERSLSQITQITQI
jgi:hypothetical protein